ncbi:MAG: M81 family metallopeptidase [Pikeienuella sp.]
MKIGVARLWHEANSFSPAIVGKEEFAAREWGHGAAAAELYRGAATEIGGALAWADARPGVALVFSRLASAPPGGPVRQELLDEVIAEIADDPALDGVDGLYLSLHGSCIGMRDQRPETTLAVRLRARFPDIPIVASFDMHCVPTEALAQALNAATVYRKYPHTDMRETAERALDMLEEMIRAGERWRVSLTRTGLILPSFNMRTDGDGPMPGIEAHAQALEAGDVRGVYPYASFSYADVPDADSGALVTARDPRAGARAGALLVERMRAARAGFIPRLPKAPETLARRPWAGGRRVAILEPSDNPLSGGGGDTPGLLAAALEADLPEGAVFAFFHDPELARAAGAAGPGASLDLRLGARLDGRYGAPVALRARVEKLTDGRFRNTGPMENGMPVDIGRTALLRAGPLRIIISSVCQSPNDHAYFALHDIDLAEVPVLLAKAKNHFHAAFGPSFDEILQVDTPGPAMADCAALPFRNIPPARFDLS